MESNNLNKFAEAFFDGCKINREETDKLESEIRNTMKNIHFIHAESYSTDMARAILQLCLRLLTEEQRIELIENLQVRIGTEPKE